MTNPGDDGELMQLLHPVNNLPGQRSHEVFPLRPRRLARGDPAPREEVALGRQLGNDAGAAIVTVDTQKLADVRVGDAVQIRRAADVNPRSLCLARMLFDEVLVALTDPSIRHMLDGHMLVVPSVAHFVHLAFVPSRILDFPNHLEAIGHPRLNLRDIEEAMQYCTPPPGDSERSECMSASFGTLVDLEQPSPALAVVSCSPPGPSLHEEIMRATQGGN
eukprot:CAMPEP_0115371890 /NCGR_PEP_ID=MMETSP0271-20121206/617_1 /TAXON_ID=71861 /ORGANISM="Scrippsiella trochoidea, Strain CCMP3099" /LENGTH=218 /DNA_ID=CAMNT_0002794811 /DNA_START=486 /DNA_END=1144 /DNA_ORIENTATION=+